jgi:predicted Zn-dependent peptidase
MFFKGTRRRNARQISEAVEGLGGYLNAFTDEEGTCIHAKAGRDHLPALLDVLQDMFLASTFDPAEIEKERDVIEEELAMYLDQPAQHIEELLNETVFPDHPLGRPLTGTRRTLRRMGRDDLLGYLRRNYVAPATLLVAAGDIEHAAVVRLARRRLGRLPTGNRPGFEPFASRQERPAVRWHRKATAQAQIALGLRVGSRHEPLRFSLRLLNTLLGENMSSRLFQALREDTGLAYSIHSSLTFFDDTGLLAIAAGVDNDQIRPALRILLKELRRLADQTPGPAELRRAKDYLRGQLDLHLENTENHMMWLGEQILAFGHPIPAAQVQRQVNAVTAAQIREAARTFLQPNRIALAVISSSRPWPGIERMLAR